MYLFSAHNCTTYALLITSAVACTAGVTLAQGGPDQQANQDAPGLIQNETSLTLNPAMPGNLVMAYNDDPYPPWCVGLGISFSVNGGTIWFDRQLPLPPGMVDAFDPISGADTMGNVYAGHVSTDGAAGGASGIYVHRSNDGGNTWPIMTPVNFSAANLNDKPHLAVDTCPGSPFFENVYVAWIWELGGGPWSDIRFAYAAPGGTVFNFPLTPPGPAISDMPTGVGMGNGPNVAVACDGTVYVVWIHTDVTQTGQLPGTFYIDTSTDGGFTWGTDVPISTILTLPSQLTDFQTPLSDAVARSFPCLEVSPFDPQELYMVYAADPDLPWSGEEANVYFIRSMDGGVTWSPPMDLNPTMTGWHEFEPWIDVKPDGTIDVAFYLGYAPDLPQSVRWQVMVTRSMDGGSTWTQPPTPIVDIPSLTPINYWGTPWMGEYLGLVVDNTYAHIAFTCSLYDQFGDVFYDRIDNAMIGAWFETFNYYNTTNPLPVQSSWEGWDNDPGAENFYATTAQSLSPPNSVIVDGVDDAVHQFSGYTTGRWTFTAWQYIPLTATGADNYFILLNEYIPDGQIGTNNWSTQLRFDPDAAIVESNPENTTLPLVLGAWAEIRVEIDLDLDTQSIYYNGALLSTKSWTDGLTGGGSLDIAAVDLWANGITYGTYYDDLSLAEILPPFCPEDVNGDLIVDILDLLAVLAAWGQSGVPADVNGDGIVDILDLLAVLAAWGPC